MTGLGSLLPGAPSDGWRPGPAPSFAGLGRSASCLSLSGVQLVHVSTWRSTHPAPGVGSAAPVRTSLRAGPDTSSLARSATGFRAVPPRPPLAHLASDYKCVPGPPPLSLLAHCPTAVAGVTADSSSQLLLLLLSSVTPRPRSL